MVRLVVVGIMELWLIQLSLKALGIDNFGLYNVVGGIVLLMNVINTSMSTTTYRYIAVEIGKKERGNPNEVFCLNLFIYFALCVLFFLFAETFGMYYIDHYLVVAEGMEDTARFVFHISVFAAILSVLFIPYQGVLIAMEDFKAKIIAEVVWTLTKVGGVLYMLYGDVDSLRVYATIMLLAVIVRALINIVYTNWKYRDVVRLRLYKNWKLCKEMLFFNNWILLGAAVCVYKSNGTAMIINYFFGTSLNAAFAVTNRVQTSIGMFAENLNTAAIPQIMKTYSGGNIERSEKLVNYISKYSFFLLFAIAFPLYCQLPYILKMWLSEVPPYTLLFCRIIIILCLFEGLGRGIPALVQATGKVKWFQIVGSAIQFLGLPVILLLYKMGYHPVTILIVLCCTTLTNAIVNLYMLYRIINFDVRSFIMTSYVRTLMVLIALIPFIWVMHSYHASSVWSLIGISFITEAYLFMTILTFGLEAKERLLIVITAKKYLNYRVY